MTDQLSVLLRSCELHARVFRAGRLCSLPDIDTEPAAGVVHFLRHGNLQLTTANNATQRLTEPTLMFFPRAAAHTLAVESGEEVELVCATVNLSACVEQSLMTALPNQMVIALSAMPSMGRVLDLMFDEAFAEHNARNIALDSYSTLLFIHLLRHAMEAGMLQPGMLLGLADQRLSKAIRAIHDDPGRTWRLEQLADIAGMSRARFAAHFASVMKMTPGAYLARFRIGVAQSLLSKGRQLKTIADECGYGSSNALTRAFKQHIGTSPSEWLESI